MTDIFISYAHEDQERVRPIVKELETRGWSVFWDKKIPAGEQWHLYIAKALNASHCVIVVWSRHSIVSDSVIEEAQVAKMKGVLVPLRIDTVDPPLGFGLIQASDLSDWKNETYDSDLLQLVNAVASKISFSAQAVIPQTPISELVEVAARGTTITSTPELPTPRPKPQLKESEKISWPSKKQNQQVAMAFAVFMLLLFVVMTFVSWKQEKMSAGQSQGVETVTAKPQSDDSLLRRAKEVMAQKEAAVAREETARLKAKQDADAQNKAAKLKAEREASVSKTIAPKIGDKYGGGIVFSVDAAGRRGLIAAKADVPGADKFSWIAAKNACQNLVENGYSDWYLPSKDELNKLYQAKSAVGGFAPNYYWSSAEYGANQAWFQDFGGGYQLVDYKLAEWRVRPVRAFYIMSQKEKTANASKIKLPRLEDL